jgi:hypothetical protein
MNFPDSLPGGRWDMLGQYMHTENFVPLARKIIGAAETRKEELYMLWESWFQGHYILTRQATDAPILHAAA